MQCGKWQEAQQLLPTTRTARTNAAGAENQSLSNKSNSNINTTGTSLLFSPNIFVIIVVAVAVHSSAPRRLATLSQFQKKNPLRMLVKSEIADHFRNAPYYLLSPPWSPWLWKCKMPRGRFEISLIDSQILALRLVGNWNWNCKYIYLVIGKSVGLCNECLSGVRHGVLLCLSEIKLNADLFSDKLKAPMIFKRNERRRRQTAMWSGFKTTLSFERFIQIHWKKDYRLGKNGSYVQPTCYLPA